MAPRIGPLLVLAVLLIAIGTWPVPALAETGVWSAPVKLSDGKDGWFPTVAADDSGRVFVVWQGSVPDQTKRDLSALYYTGYDGQTWSTPNDIQLISPSGVALRSSLLFDPWGHLDLIYKGLGQLTDNPLGQEDLWFKSVEPTKASVPTKWSMPYRITREPQGYYSDMAVDSHGVIHAIWTESSGGSWGIYYSHSVDAGVTWSQRIPLDPVNPVWWYRTHITVDGQDRIHVVWETLAPKAAPLSTDAGTTFGVTSAAYYAMSKDGGTTWSTTVFADKTASPILDTSLVPGPQQPSIGVDGGGKILFVYREYGTNRVFYRTSTDGTHWSDAIPLPGVTSGTGRPFDIYDMITDSSGRVHLAMVGFRAGSKTMELLNLEWDGQKWGAPEVIADSPPFPEYPKLALSDGNRLHVVWFGGDRAGVERTPLGIWYSTSLTTAPPRARPEMTHVVAAPTSVGAPTPAVEATPLPRPPRAVENEPRATSSLDDQIASAQQSPAFPLLLGILPVIGVWTLILIVRIGSSARLNQRGSVWTAPFRRSKFIGGVLDRSRAGEESDYKP
jgi:hypothetical protein